MRYPIRLEKHIDPSQLVVEEEKNDTNTTQSKKKKAKEKVLFEYAIAEPKIFDINELLTVDSGSYSNMFCFHAKGEMLFVFVQDGQNVISFDAYKDKIKKSSMPNGEIKAVERWSAFTYVQYENVVEFIQFDKREIIDPVSKIMLSEPILTI